MLEERARDELPKSAAAALAAATSVSREVRCTAPCSRGGALVLGAQEVQRTKDDFDKVSKELNDKVRCVSCQRRVCCCGFDLCYKYIYILYLVFV